MHTFPVPRLFVRKLKDEICWTMTYVRHVMFDLPFDNSYARLPERFYTKMPPTPKGHVDLSDGGHGWVCFSLDGRYAWCHTPDVFDVKTKQLVATLKDETGKPVSSSKFIEVHFRDGKVVGMGNEFGLGRK